LSDGMMEEEERLMENPDCPICGEKLTYFEEEEGFPNAMWVCEFCGEYAR